MIARIVVLTSALIASTALAAPDADSCAGVGEVLNRQLGYINSTLPKCEDSPHAGNPNCGALATFAEILADSKMLQRFAACHEAGISVGEFEPAILKALDGGLTDRIDAVSGALQ